MSGKILDLCPVCKTDVLPEDDKRPCHRCMAWHHEACWKARGHCGACSNRWVYHGNGVSSAPCPDPIPVSDAEVAEINKQLMEIADRVDREENAACLRILGILFLCLATVIGLCYWLSLAIEWNSP